MGDPRFKGIEFKVGLFIMAAMVMVIVTVIIFAIQSDLLTKKTPIIVYANSGEGLKKGMPVIYSGFQISRVDSLFLEDSGRVKINIGIPIKYTKWIKVDSVVKIISQNFIGSQSLVFSGGTPGTTEVLQYSEFTLIRDKGIEEIIEKAKPVMDDIKIIVSNLRILSDRVADDNGDFSKLMNLIGDISQQTSEKTNSLGILLKSNYMTDKIDTLLADIDQTQQKVDHLILQADKAAIAATDRIHEIQATIPLVNDNLKLSKQLINDVDLKIQKLDPIITDVKSITANVSDSTHDLKLLRNDIELITDTSLEMILELNHMWPFAPDEKGGTSLKLP